MIRGLYTAAADLEAEIARQGMMANNIANVNTVGYKQDVPTLETALAQLLAMDTGPAGSAPEVGELAGAVANVAPEIDLSQGPLEATYQDLDMAILGDGFWQVLTPDGVRYTRDGTLTRDAAGRLVTADGYFVLGDGGPITLGDGQVAVAEDGTVYVNHAPVGRLALVQPAEGAAIERLADNLMQFDATQPVPAAQTRIRQGFLERSNVDATATMVGMMTTLRAYEASQRMLQMHDQALQRVIDIGRPV